MNLFSPSIARMLDELSERLLATDLGELRAKNRYFPIAMSLERYGQGSFLEGRYPDEPSLRKGFEGREPTLIGFALELLHGVEPAEALRVAVEIVKLGKTAGHLDAHVRSGALRVLETDLGAVPFELVLALGFDGEIESTGPLESRVELASSAARLALFDRIEHASNPGVTGSAKKNAINRFTTNLRKDIVARGVAEDDALLLARLAKISEDEAHPYFREALVVLLGRLTFDEIAAKLDASISDARRSAIGSALLGKRGIEPEKLAHLMAETLPANVARPKLGIDAHFCLTCVLADLRRGSLRKDDAALIRLGLGCSAAHQPKEIIELARVLLTLLDQEAVEKALKAAGVEAPKTRELPAPPLPKKLDFLARYERGEHEAVWRELCALGKTVRDPKVEPQALAVARAAMARLKGNLDRIVKALKKGKYAPMATKPVEAAKNGAKEVDALEKVLKGEVPIALRAFYETFAHINLRESPNALVDTYALDEELGRKDPLVVYPLKRLAPKLKEAASTNAKLCAPLREPLRIWLSPSVEGKDDPDKEYDGIDMWDGELPDAGFDLEVGFKGGRAYFVDRLRAYVARGGFLLSDDPATTDALAKGLESF